MSEKTGGTVNLMAAGERLSPIAFVKRPLLLPAIPPWLIPICID